jgi:hypothetical protein
MSEKSKRKVGRPRVITTDYNLLAEIEDINNIPDVATKVLRALGTGCISLYSAEKMLGLLRTANAISFSSLSQDMKQKYKIITQVSEMIKRDTLPALKTIEIEDEEYED